MAQLRSISAAVPNPVAPLGRKKGGHNSWRMSASGSSPPREKLVWLWTESRQVMTAAVERGWSTFLFTGDRRSLSEDWSSVALINPLVLRGSDIIDRENAKIASFHEISSPQQLEHLHPDDDGNNHVVIHLHGEWQIIPAENIVAKFQGRSKAVLAVASSYNEARIFLEALEQGLGGVVLKVEDVHQILQLKEYFDRIREAENAVGLSRAAVTKVQGAGMGDRVCVDLCSIMLPGEGLLVGSFARGLFLVHSECLESNYIASRPFRVNAARTGSCVRGCSRWENLLSFRATSGQGGDYR